MKIIATYMNDIGRQRITKYVSKKFEKSSNLSKQFNKEMHKIKQLTKMMGKKKKKKVDLQAKKSRVKHKDDQTNEKSHSNVRANQIDEFVVKKDKEKNKNKNENKNTSTKKTHYVRKAVELKNLFYVTNRILHKYQLSKCCFKYQCTMQSTQSLVIKTKEKVNINAKKQKAKSSSSSISMQQIANDAKATSFYNSIKTNLIAQKSYRAEKGVNEVLGFKEVLKSKTSNVTYRFARVSI